MDRDWWAEVTEWIAHIAGAPVELRETRERVWGVVALVTTSQGDLYFKAPGVRSRHEKRLLVDLQSEWPELVPQVVAADDSRGWMLLADHGSPMGAVLDPTAQFGVLERLLPVYGAMQAATMPLVPGWLDARTPNRRVELLPDLFGKLVGNTRLPFDADDRLGVESTRVELARVCDLLGATPMAAAIDHCDIHEGNVLVDGADARLIDWGDACVTHPFVSLFVPFQFVVAGLGAERRSKAIRLRDAYLEAWGSDLTLRETFSLATWVAAILRALSVAHHTVDATGSWAEDDQNEITMLVRAWRAEGPRLAMDDLLFEDLYC